MFCPKLPCIFKLPLGICFRTYTTCNLIFNDCFTHWSRMTHICVSKLTIIGSDNGLSPIRRRTIIWAYAVILLIRPKGTIFSEILFEISVFSFKKMHLKTPSGKWRPSCLGVNVLKQYSGRLCHKISTPHRVSNGMWPGYPHKVPF